MARRRGDRASPSLLGGLARRRARRAARRHTRPHRSATTTTPPTDDHDGRRSTADDTDAATTAPSTGATRRHRRADGDDARPVDRRRRRRLRADHHDAPTTVRRDAGVGGVRRRRWRRGCSAAATTPSASPSPVDGADRPHRRLRLPRAAAAAPPPPPSTRAAVRIGAVHATGRGPDRRRRRPPARADRAGDRFRIASICKVITAIVVLQLVEAGQLGLDEPVGERLAAARRRHVADPQRRGDHRAPAAVAHVGLPDVPEHVLRRSGRLVPGRRPARPVGVAAARRPARATRTRTSTTACSACSSSRSPGGRTRPSCTDRLLAPLGIDGHAAGEHVRRRPGRGRAPVGARRATTWRCSARPARGSPRRPTS